MEVGFSFLFLGLTGSVLCTSTNSVLDDLGGGGPYSSGGSIGILGGGKKGTTWCSPDSLNKLLFLFFFAISGISDSMFVGGGGIFISSVGVGTIGGSLHHKS